MGPSQVHVKAPQGPLSFICIYILHCGQRIQYVLHNSLKFELHSLRLIFINVLRMLKRDK